MDCQTIRQNLKRLMITTVLLLRTKRSPRTGQKARDQEEYARNGKGRRKGKYKLTGVCKEGRTGSRLYRFLLEAKKNNNYEYLKRRGINESVQDYFEIGYVEAWISPKAVETTIKKAEILPTFQGLHAALFQPVKQVIWQEIQERNSQKTKRNILKANMAGSIYLI